MKRLLIFILLLISFMSVEGKTFTFITDNYEWRMGNQNWIDNNGQKPSAIIDFDMSKRIIIVTQPIGLVFHYTTKVVNVVHGIKTFVLNAYNKYLGTYHIVIYKMGDDMFFVFYGKVDVLYDIDIS